MICKHYSHWMFSIDTLTKKPTKCRICFEESTGKQFDRFSVCQMKCSFCYCVQPVNSSCINPDCTMYKKKHKYYCNICHLWENKPQKEYQKYHDGTSSFVKPIYHCQSCGVCRIGNSHFYRHCEKCNMCIPTRRNILNSKKTSDNHSCWGIIHENPCPICYSDIFQSNSPGIFLRCGHAIHYECMNDYIKHGGYKCPTCQNPIVDIPTIPKETIYNLIHSLEEEDEEEEEEEDN
jgi:RING finger/CHY zinc finger protein 1